MINTNEDIPYDHGMAYNDQNFDESDIMNDYFCDGDCEDCFMENCKLRNNLE